MTSWTRVYICFACSTSAITLWTLFIYSKINRFCFTKAGIHKGNIHSQKLIFSLTWSILISRTAGGREATHASAKETGEYVIQIIKASAGKSTHVSKTTGALLSVNTCKSKLIISLSFLRITQNFICFVDLFELFCSTRFFIQIRMIFFCQFTIGSFYFIFCSTFGYPKHFIVISFFSHIYTLLL